MTAIVIIGLAIAAVVFLPRAVSAAAQPSLHESPPVQVVPADVPPELATGVASAIAESSSAADEGGGSVLGTVATIAATAAVATIATRLLASYNAQKARIAAEGEWAGQIRVFLAGTPVEVFRDASVMDIAQGIVTHFGFGGSWRLTPPFPNPIQGMAYVLTAPFQRTLNLRAINSTYQGRLRRAAGVSRSDWRRAVAKVAMGLKFNPIIALKLEPWASEMKAIARGEFPA